MSSKTELNQIMFQEVISILKPMLKDEALNQSTYYFVRKNALYTYLLQH